MIRVTVELVPLGVGTPVTIGTCEIYNDLSETWDDPSRGAYVYTICGKRGLLKGGTGRITGFPRKSKNVWHLVARCLRDGGFK